MSHLWAGDRRIGIAVVVSTAGPTDPPLSGTLYNLTNHAGHNYVRGDPGIQIDRGRSDEFSHFQSGTCTFTLNNNQREFDPARTEIALDLPAGTSNATTPDVTAFAPAGDLDFRMRLSMENWVPGAFGRILASQWTAPSDKGWLLAVNASGTLQFSFTTDGATDRTRISTVPVPFAPGSVHWLRWALDVDNGAAGHDVIFYTSEDGNTWNQLGATVTNAGTVTAFNSTSTVLISDTALPMSGQVYRFQFRNNNIVVADPDFTAQTPTTVGFTDRVDRIWTVNGTASIRYDNYASPFAPILKSRRQVYVIAALIDDPSTTRYLFTGYLEGWPQTWTNTTGAVPMVANDLLSILAQATTTEGTGVLILDNPQQGRLDQGRLAGDLPEQSTGQRIRDLVGLAGVSSLVEQIDDGITDVVAVEPTGDVLSLCQEAETAEAGFLYVDTQGKLVFLDRHARFRDTRLGTVQETFTDDEYTGLSVDYGLAQMWNVARFIRPAVDDADTPDEQIAMDDVSMAELGRRSYPQSGATQIPVTSDSEALARAEFWVDRYSIPKQRPSPVVVNMRRDITDFLCIAGRELLDRIELVRTPLGLGQTITFTGLLEQIRHRITEEEWDCTLATSPIDVDEGQTFLILDDANLGQLDQESLAY